MLMSGWFLRRRTPFALAVVALLAGGCVIGGKERLEDRTTAPIFAGNVVEQVAALDYPPGNIAVSETGRVFFSYHPDGSPPVNVLELIDGKPVPYPSEAFQQRARGTPHFDTVLSMRIDRQGRLWVLDHARFARGQPRLLAFDLQTDAVVHDYAFPSKMAPFLSMLNDFQVSPDGTKIYIAEASPIRQNPALIVYDTVNRSSRRLLENHPSVRAGYYILQAPGRDMIFFGFYNMRVGVDSIALDKRGEWLYYGPLTGDRLYRIRTADLNDASLSADALGARVEDYGPKTISDGLTMDEDDNVYITDPEHSAILTLGPDRRLETLVKEPFLRWPDGLSFGPEGWLYVTCSSLHHVLFVSSDRMRANAPYHIFRFKPGPMGVPGH
jgi:sugar lactone lactonase YvrE